MDLLRAIRKRKKGTKISEIQKNIVRTNQNLLLFFESYYLVISYLKAYRFSRRALKIDRFLLTFHIWETRVSESRDPKRGVPSVSNDIDRLRVRKFEGESFVLNSYASFSTFLPTSLFNREANYKPKGISLLDWMFMLANNVRGQWSWYTNFVDRSFSYGFKQTLASW